MSSSEDDIVAIPLTLLELEYIIGVLGEHDINHDDSHRFPRDEMEALYEWLFENYTNMVLDTND